MRIAVCVKHCFDTEARIEIEDGRVREDNIVFVMNPYDEVALEEALLLRESGLADEVVAVSAGGDQVATTLRSALAMGADRAALVRRPDDADEYHTATVLADALRQETPDLVLAGHVSSDDASSQVPARIAQELGLPHVNMVSSLKVEGRDAICTHEIDGGLETVRVSLPAVISTQINLNEPRYISYRGIKQARTKPLETIDATNASRSNARVLSYELPVAKEPGVKIADEPGEAARILAHWIFSTTDVKIGG